MHVNDNPNEDISILMPTYNQGSFILRAVKSLINQTYTNWELIIILDGCTDNTSERIEGLKADKRVRIIKNIKNHGLGVSLNKGIKLARYNYIAYLPSDDVYYSNHLETLITSLKDNEDSVLSYSGINSNYVYSVLGQNMHCSNGQINGSWLQLVQVLHKKTDDKWLPRDELVIADLFRMYWKNLVDKGRFVTTNELSCEW